MNVYKPFIQSAALHLQATNLVLSTAPLHRQIQDCYQQLMPLSAQTRTPEIRNQLRDLQDEIFGCEIEIQSLQLKAKRLINESRALRSQAGSSGRSQTLDDAPSPVANCLV